jgi:hypothetical protein
MEDLGKCGWARFPWRRDAPFAQNIRAVDAVEQQMHQCKVELNMNDLFIMIMHFEDICDTQIWIYHLLEKIMNGTWNYGSHPRCSKKCNIYMHMHTTCTSFLCQPHTATQRFLQTRKHTHCFFFVFDMIKMKTMYSKFLLYFWYITIILKCIFHII